MISPQKAFIYTGLTTVFVLLPAFLLTRDKTIRIKGKPNKYQHIFGSFLIFSMLGILVILALLLAYGLIVADPKSKYPTLQPWINLRELYIGPFKTSWKN